MNSLRQTAASFEDLEGRVLLSASSLASPISLALTNNAATASGSLTSSTAAVYYKLTAGASGLLAVSGCSGAATPAMDAQVSLYNSKQTLVKTVTATSPTGSAILDASVQSGQVYYAEVSSGNQKYEAYKLAVTDTPDTPPVIAAVAPTTALVGAPVRFTVSASDANGQALTYSMRSLPSGATFNATTHVFSWTPSSSQTGTFSPVISVSDGLTATTATVSLAVTSTPAGDWSGAAATLTLNSSGAATDDGLLTTGTDQHMFKIVATQSGTMTVAVTNTASSPTSVMQVNFYDSGPTWLTNAVASSATGAATLQYAVTASTTYYVKVLSSNSKPGSFQMAVTTAASAPVLQPPIVTAIAPVTATAGTPIQFTVSATDPNGLALTYSAANLPSGSTFSTSTHVFSWTPTSSQTGTFAPVFTASDGTLSASQTASITVNAAASQPPVMTAIAPVTATAGADPVHRQRHRSKRPDADVLGLEPAVGLGVQHHHARVQLDAHQRPDGHVSPVFTASDGTLSASQTASITVKAAALQAPVMSAIAPVSVTVSTPIQFTVSATDPNGLALTYSASSLPSGSTFSTSTHVFSWTPTSTQTGTFSPVFTASDGTLSASQTATLTVAAASSGGGGNYNDGNMGSAGTTATYISQDNSGYGVNAPNGPDADPTDPAVNTYAQALAKYGSVTGILNHLGYDPLRIFYISNSGSDSTGVVNDINHPYADWAGVEKLLKPGDAVIFRAGTYYSPTSTNGDGAVMADPGYCANGTAANPIIVMGMPGEQATLVGSSSSEIRTNGIWCTGQHFIFDNLSVSSQTDEGAGIKVASGAAYDTFTNINAHAAFLGNPAQRLLEQHRHRPLRLARQHGRRR